MRGSKSQIRNERWFGMTHKRHEQMQDISLNSRNKKGDYKIS
jgi:hypothetical protein